MTKERKQTKQTKKLNRGHTLKKAIKEAAIPIQVTVIMVEELDENQNSVGACQYRVVPKYCAAARK